VRRQGAMEFAHALAGLQNGLFWLCANQKSSFPIHTFLVYWEHIFPGSNGCVLFLR